MKVNVPAVLALSATVTLSMTTVRYLSARFPSLTRGLPQSDSFSDDIKFGIAIGLLGVTYVLVYNGVKAVIK